MSENMREDIKKCTDHIRANSELTIRSSRDAVSFAYGYLGGDYPELEEFLQAILAAE